MKTKDIDLLFGVHGDLFLAYALGSVLFRVETVEPQRESALIWEMMTALSCGGPNSGRTTNGAEKNFRVSKVGRRRAPRECTTTTSNGFQSNSNPAISATIRNDETRTRGAETLRERERLPIHRKTGTYLP